LKNLPNCCLILSTIFMIFTGCRSKSINNRYQSALPRNIQRTWIGPEFWTNPLQDWQLNNGRIECITSGGDRSVFLLTHELSSEPGTLEMSVTLGRLKTNQEELLAGWVGFKIGVRGQFDDYRDDAVRGVGLPLGMTTDGLLFIGRVDSSVKRIEPPYDTIRLMMSAIPSGDKYRVKLSAYSKDGRILSQIGRSDINSDWLSGGVSLVCSHGKIQPTPETRPVIDDGNWGFRRGTTRGGNVRFWFTDWKVSGTKVRAYPDRAFGPILFAQYTLSKGVMKMTVQMVPIGSKDGNSVRLQIKKTSGGWKTIAESPIDSMSRTASFRIEDWETDHNIPYRLIYYLYSAGDRMKLYTFKGIIRKEPWDKEEIVVAAFTGNNDLGFPNNDIVRQIKYHNPDILFFSGDQIYEGVGGFGVQRKPVDKATLDYLRKWYLYGWAYCDLIKDRPTITIPDDHDVFHGNLWGAGGKPTPPGLSGYKAQDCGGYRMPPEWVNMVQRTQTSHLPDPYDPTPVEQGIGVYYCEMNYAGISFAILEDRKFKSAPKILLPQAKIRNGWAQNRSFNAKKEADVKGAVLLGERQLEFLRHWAVDWSNKTWMKVALSQTIFSNVATLPEEAKSGDIIPRLRILKEGEYPPDDVPVSDMDSNGWPQSGRNRAIKELRRCFALHIAGDQHLGSTIQYGIRQWHDGSFAFCVPAISNVWPRRWCPKSPGRNRAPGSPHYTGDFEDGFGNKISVYAVSNPVFTGLKPSRLYDRATGYGIIRFNRKTRKITIECWRRQADPSRSDSGQYPGWPITIKQIDNYIGSAKLFLPLIEVKNMTDPVIQVIDESSGEIVYSIRINGTRFQPKVFEKGSYKIRVGEPGKTMKQISKLIPVTSREAVRRIVVDDF